MLTRFFVSGLPKGPTSKPPATWLTLLALYLLDSEFYDREAEWTLIARKARSYLRRNGIDPD